MCIPSLGLVIICPWGLRQTSWRSHTLADLRPLATRLGRLSSLVSPPRCEENRCSIPQENTADNLFWDSYPRAEVEWQVISQCVCVCSSEMGPGKQDKNPNISTIFLSLPPLPLVAGSFHPIFHSIYILSRSAQVHHILFFHSRSGHLSSPVL